MEIFATGLAMGESPRWHDGRLWVCDWMAGEVLSYDDDGTPRVEQTMTGIPFSVDWLPDGRCLLSSAKGVVLGDGTTYGLAGQPLNEIVVDPRGLVFVNAAGYDPMSGEEERPGFVWVVRPDGSSAQMADGLWFPNGMAVTDDGATLLVAESHGQRLTAFSIAEDGTLADRRVWADLGDDAPDGICVDADGAVWYASVPGRHCVRVAEGGEVLERVQTEDGCFACMLGGDDGRTLFAVTMPWGGMNAIGGSERNGRVLTYRAPAPHAGRP